MRSSGSMAQVVMLKRSNRQVETATRSQSSRGLNPFPDRGVGLGDEQSMRLAVNVIGLRRGQQDGPPVVDSMVLTKADWQTLVPRRWNVRCARGGGTGSLHPR